MKDEDEFIIIERPVKTPSFSYSVFRITLNCLRFIWKHGNYITHGVPIIILLIYLYPILVLQYKHVAMVYATYSSVNNTYRYYKKLSNYYCSVLGWIQAIYD
jgi:hypothetical protein